MPAEWPELLFLELADLYLPQLEGLLERAEVEADGLSKILSTHGIEAPAKILTSVAEQADTAWLWQNAGFKSSAWTFRPNF